MSSFSAFTIPPAHKWPRGFSVPERETGLGSAIAKHIISAHGRSIWATSVEEHESTFYFTLPEAH